MAYLWNAFLRLHCRRSSGFSSNPISWSDIAAFSHLSRLRFESWEIEIIELLDGLYLNEAADMAKKKSEQASDKTKQSKKKSG